MWAVGAALGAGTTPLVEHWDGHTWSIVATPAGSASGSLTAVAATAAHDVWAVGSYDEAAGGGALAERWDGTRWNVVGAPVEADFGALAAVTTQDVWGAGTGGVVEHWDGSTWQLVLTGASSSSPAPHARDRPSPPDERRQGVAQASATRVNQLRLPAGLAPVLQRTLARDSAASYRPHWQGQRYVAGNAAQRLALAFRAGGVQITPVGSALRWRWGITLASYGTVRAAHAVRTVRPVLVGERVEYRRDGVTEWYVNSPRGLEQGFTVATPPAGWGPREAVVLGLRITGGLRPRVAGGGQVLVFAARGGGPALVRFSGVEATDARGRRLTTSLEIAPRGQAVQIVVEAQGAAFPLRVDPWVQQAELVASDAAIRDEFGFSVALSGDGSTALIGARYKNLELPRFRGEVRARTTQR